MSERLDLILRRSAQALLDYGVKVKIVKGFDPAAAKVVEGTITMAETPKDERLPITVEKLERVVTDDKDGLVVAADVLANSLHYHFKKRSQDKLYGALNTPDAFATHPLYECLDSFWNWGGYNFTDTFYRHPLDPALKQQAGS